MIKNKLKYYSLKLAFFLFLIPFGIILLIAEMLTGVAYSIESKLEKLAQNAGIKHKKLFKDKTKK